jgi:hypothetical protein
VWVCLAILLHWEDFPGLCGRAGRHLGRLYRSTCRFAYAIDSGAFHGSTCWPTHAVIRGQERLHPHARDAAGFLEETATSARGLAPNHGTILSLGYIPSRSEREMEVLPTHKI